MKKHQLEKIDILNEDGSKTGKTSTIDEAKKHGYLHYGVHALVLTPRGKIITQKRANKMWLHPNTIELGAGGFVSAGESCDEAIKREIYEELGLEVAQKNIRLVKVSRWNRWHPSTRTRNNGFLYSYIAVLNTEEPEFTLQKEETKSAEVVSYIQAKKLVRRHAIKSLGVIEPLYGYWKYYLRLTDEYLRPTIHIVCRGNKFRSRLAQAYLRSLCIPQIRIESSGIDVAKRTSPNFVYYTSELMNKHNLNGFTQKRKYQTEQSKLDAASLVIFVSPTVYADAKERYKLDKGKCEVWNIKDIVGKDYDLPKEQQQHLTDVIYKTIATSVDALANTLPKRFPQIND